MTDDDNKKPEFDANEFIAAIMARLKDATSRALSHNETMQELAEDTLRILKAKKEEN